MGVADLFGTGWSQRPIVNFHHAQSQGFKGIFKSEGSECLFHLPEDGILSRQTVAFLPTKQATGFLPG